MTLYDRITRWMQIQRDKHELGETYVEDTVNEMSLHDLLKAISDELGDLPEPR